MELPPSLFIVIKLGQIGENRNQIPCVGFLFPGTHLIILLSFLVPPLPRKGAPSARIHTYRESHRNAYDSDSLLPSSHLGMEEV